MENRLVTETGLVLRSDKIREGDMQRFESMTGSNLQYDTLSVTVEGNIFRAAFKDKNGKQVYTSDNKRFVLDTSSTWKYGRWLKYYYGDDLQGKFYIENVKRVGKERYQITAISAVGLLANSQHYGGVYQGKKFVDLCAEIIGGQIPFSVDLTVANQLVYGWLPIATRRENLHQLLFAMNASVKKDANGDVYITALSKDTATNIPDNRIFNGGSIDFPQASKAIALSEHAYIARNTDETVTLYNSEIPADSITTPNGNIVLGGLILFDEPAHDLQITGATIIESGVNYAVLSPTAECTLTGKKYTHTVRQVTRPEVIDNVTDDNKVTVPNATLVSVANSEGVAERLARYYGSAKKVTMDILQGSEKAGDCVTFNDPWDEATEGLISSIDTKMSGILRSTIEVIADYDPPDIGNYYDSVVMLTNNTTWNIPEGNDKVRIVLIGGGQAGFKGEDGAQGTLSDYDWGVPTKGQGGIGGHGGIGGNGGKILIKTLDVSEISSLTITIGSGNTGGNGGNGGNTTLTAGGTTYTSADGSTSSVGFIETFSGNAYGYAGEDHSTLKAGNGGDYNNNAFNAGDDYTDSDGTWTGGTVGAQIDIYSSITGKYAHLFGGTGGGATHGSNGGNGGDAVTGDNGHGGNGGNGGNGSKGKNATVYGCGGSGGYGGGGGGCGGIYVGSDGDPSTFYPYGALGAGGQGGLGGNGAAGCVFIYYND